MDRRDFITRTLAASSLAGFLAQAQAENPAAAGRGGKETIRLAMIGLGARANTIIDELAKIENIALTALCDVDAPRLQEKAVTYQEKMGGEKPQLFADYRELFASGLVDAVFITTPNHWHASMTIAACEAGLDVYVEKPISHSIAEGQAMLAAAKKHGRIVMAGTQNRADTSIQAAKDWLAEDPTRLGELQSVHCFWFVPRQPIGLVKKPTPVPESINYNLFQGPAPLTPLMREQIHYDWHWQWPTGNGEMGNLGIHVLDQALFFLGLDGQWPKKMESVGARLIGPDDGDTPSDHFIALDFGQKTPMTLEVAATGSRRISRYSAAAQLVYEKGTILISRGGSAILNEDGKLKQRFRGDSGGRIFPNFIDCVRTGKEEGLLAPLKQGHISTSICHAANIAHRIGQSGVSLDDVASNSQLISQTGSRWEAFRDYVQERVQAGKADLALTPLTLSPLLALDGDQEKFLETGAEGEAGTMGNYLLSEVRRSEFEAKRPLDA